MGFQESRLFQDKLFLLADTFQYKYKAIQLRDRLMKEGRHVRTKRTVADGWGVYYR